MAETLYTGGDYLKQHPTWHTEDSLWKADQVLHALRRANFRPLTVGDIGCGAGEVLRLLKGMLVVPECHGYDISPNAIAMCRSEPGLRYSCVDLLSTNDRFDLLLALDVVEHVEDYFGFLRRMRAHAHKVIIHWPLDMTVHGVFRKLPMLARRELGHLHYFDQYTALATMRECGYEIVDWFYTPKVELGRNIGNFLREAAFAIAPRFTVDVLGNYGLMVTATSATENRT